MVLGIRRRRARRWRRATIMLLAVTGLVGGVFGTTQGPEITIGDVEFKNASMDGIELTIPCSVLNKNVWELSMSNITLTTFVNDIKVGASNVTGPIKLPAGKEVEIEVNMLIAPEIWDQVMEGSDSFPNLPEFDGVTIRIETVIGIKVLKVIPKSMETTVTKDISGPNFEIIPRSGESVEYGLRTTEEPIAEEDFITWALIISLGVFTFFGIIYAIGGKKKDCEAAGGEWEETECKIPKG